MQYTITSGINPTLRFNGDEKAYYKYAAAAIRLGNFTGRLSIRLIKTPYGALLVFSSITNVLFIIYMLQSIFRFVTAMYVMLILGIILGLCSGVNYANSMHQLQIRVHDEPTRKFALSFASVMANIGAVIATILGTGMELWLKMAK